jgi:hypothetical protein
VKYVFEYYARFSSPYTLYTSLWIYIRHVHSSSVSSNARWRLLVIVLATTFTWKNIIKHYCKLPCQIISLLAFVLRRKNLRIIVFHVSKNSTNPIACADFQHTTLLPNSVIIYRGSCPIFYKISTIIKKSTASTTHGILHFALRNFSAVPNSYFTVITINTSTHFVVVLYSSV